MGYRLALRLCFVVNPLAGIGGKLALKGSDGEKGLEALRRRAELVAPLRARRFLRELEKNNIERYYFLTASGIMGADFVREVKGSYSIVHRPSRWPTTRDDTIVVVRECLRRGAEVVVFVGGDGTARDVVEAIRSREVPILGVPSGVKVYSSVFAESPEAAAGILSSWASSRSICRGEILDVDEEAYRMGRLDIRLYAEASIPCSQLLVGSSKQPSRMSPEEVENRKAIAEYILDKYVTSCTLLVLGPGTTIEYIAKYIGVSKTLLGVDVVHNSRLVLSDATEEELYEVVKKHIDSGGRVLIIVTPIGGQGYILGRGNQQISPRVVRYAGGRSSLLVVSTRYKLLRTKKLRIDTDDPEFNREMKGYIRVVVDYGEEVVVRVE